MKVIHQHPTYISEEERMEQLRTLIKNCIITVKQLRNRSESK